MGEPARAAGGESSASYASASATPLAADHVGRRLAAREAAFFCPRGWCWDGPSPTRSNPVASAVLASTVHVRGDVG
jgi:hypothetical protein